MNDEPANGQPVVFMLGRGGNSDNENRRNEGKELPAQKFGSRHSATPGVENREERRPFGELSGNTQIRGKERAEMGGDTIVIAARKPLRVDADGFVDISDDEMEETLLRGDERDARQEEDQEDRVEENEEEQEAMVEHEGQEDIRDEDRDNAARHSEAYAEMTRGAAPLPPSARQQTSVSPSRKRLRVNEIAASDASTNNEPISPHKYAESERIGYIKRLCTLQSPLIQMDSTKPLLFDNYQDKVCKRERVGPLWLMDALEKLQEKYEGSCIEPMANNCLRCVDCPEKVFKATANKKFGGLDTHLRGQTHKANMEARINAQCQEEFMSTSKASNMIDFNVPVDPLTVFANHSDHNNTDLNAATFHWLSVAAKDLQLKESAIQITQNRLSSLESKFIASTKQQTAILETSQRAEEKYQSISERQTAADQNYKTQFDDIRIRVSRNDLQLHEKFEDMDRRVETTEQLKDEVTMLEEEIKSSNARSEEALKGVSQQVTRLRTRNTEDNETIRADLDVLKESSNAQLDQLVAMEETAGIHTKKIGALEKYCDTLLDHIERLEGFTQEQKENIFGLESRASSYVEELQDLQVKDKVSQQKISTLESQVELQAGELQRLRDKDDISQQNIFDLETQVHACTKELQRKRDSEEDLRRTFSDLIAVQNSRTEIRLNALTECFEAQLKSQEKALVGKFISRIQLSEKASAKRIVALETLSQNTDLQERVDDLGERLGKTLPAVFEEIEELKEVIYKVTDEMDDMEPDEEDQKGDKEVADEESSACLPMPRVWSHTEPELETEEEDDSS